MQPPHMKRRIWSLRSIAAGLLVAIIVGAEFLLSLEANRASNQQHWPGPLDVLRRYPWVLALLLLIIVIVLSIVLKSSERSQSEQHINQAYRERAFSFRK